MSLGYSIGSFPNVEKQAKEILSLPIHQNLKIKDLKIITNKINGFLN